MGKDIPLSGDLRPGAPALRRGRRVPRALRGRPEVKEVVDTARGLEGLKRQWGVHAAGVILSREPLLDVIPIQRREQDGAIITQFDMGACETLGLLKMDFLGLRNLTVLDDCLENIEPNRRAEARPRRRRRWTTRRPTSCWPAATRSACSSSTAGRCAPCCADGARPSSRTSPPSLALYRPGPMGANAHNDYADRKNGRKPVMPIHPELAEPLEDILGETYGLIVYQEQVMAIAQKLAGYSLGKADLLRRAMGKKKKEILDKEYVRFAAGHEGPRLLRRPRSRRCGTSCVPFSDYAFNRAHTAGYGLVSYWTAYLKANYPAEYMAALLTSVARRQGQVRASTWPSAGGWASRCCRRTSTTPTRNFTPVGTDIRFGLAAIRNVGANVVDVDRRGPQGEGRVHRLLRLPAQGRRGGLQQEGHRVADQGGRVRLARAHRARACCSCTPRRSTR